MTTGQQWTDAIAWQTQDINNTNDPQKKYHLGTVSINILLLSTDKDSTVYKTEYLSKTNPTGKPRWAWQKPKISPPTISSIHKSLSRNCHRVWSPTHQRAIKEESKVAKRDWADHQACSLLQYTKVIATRFILRIYFDKLRWKLIRANNLLHLI